LDGQPGAHGMTRTPPDAGGPPGSRPAPTRRERRAAERAARRGSAITTTRGSGPSAAGGRSPVLPLTIAAVVVGVVAVVVLVLASGGIGGPALPAVAAAPGPPPPVELRDGRSLGDPAAAVSIEVYEDPQCIACAQYVETIEPLLVNGPVRDGRVRLTYRDRIIFGQESMDAAVGMRAADVLAGKFWDFHDIVYANHAGEDAGAFSRDRLAEMAEMIGLERGPFLELLDDPALITAVQQESQEGQARGINSTPTLVIDGTPFPGVPSWEQLKERIAAAEAAGA
jgi:protein-disulfide isomerase